LSNEQGSGEKRNGIGLLVIDVQKGLFRRPTPVYNAQPLLENISTLIERARDADVPVFYIQHANKSLLVEGTDDWQLHPQLQPLNGDCVIHKRHGSAFKGTSLREELETRNIGWLVVTGLVTRGCVRATCIDAKKHGYNVVLVKDGHSSYHRQAARLVEEWNEKLRGDGVVELRTAREIYFRDNSDS
jgi:nicotinamidase-related amidase